jgi:RNA polymerase sigma-70 factor (ECF subfamily)
MLASTPIIFACEALTVADGTTTELTACLDRLRAGDHQARGALVTRAYNRLRLIARRQMRRFDRIRRFEDTDDVLQNAAVRLLRRLETHPPADPADFFALAAREIRRELLDLVRSHFGPLGAGHREVNRPDPGPSAGPGQSTHSPDRLSQWREFHEQVERLPDAERAVFDLLWYHGLTQPEAAAVLGVSVPTVQRRWLDARLHLRDVLP